MLNLKQHPSISLLNVEKVFSFIWLEYKILKVSLTFMFLCKLLGWMGIQLSKRIKHKNDGTIKLEFTKLELKCKALET